MVQGLVAVLEIVGVEWGDGGFTPEELDVCMAYKNDVDLGPMIESAILYNKQIKSAKQLEAVVELSQAMASAQTLDAILRVMREQSKTLLRADKCTVFMVKASDCSLSTTFDDGHLVRIPAGKGIVGHVALTGETVMIDDAYTDNRFDRTTDAITGYRTRAVLAMAVQDQTQKIKHLEREKATLTEKLELSSRDTMSEVANLSKKLEKQVELCERLQEELDLVK